MRTTDIESRENLDIPEAVEVEALANPHSHLRENEVVLPLIMKAIEGGVDMLGPMPNTSTGLTTAEEVVDYIYHATECVAKQLGARVRFLPIVMLTEDTTEEQIVKCAEAKIFDGKMYPYLRTTKSERGIQKWGAMIPVMKWCAKYKVRVHGHFEHPNPMYSDRDAEFMCLPVVEILLQETEADIIWEHGSDGRCVPNWKDMACSGRFFLTLTAHHLVTNEDRARRDVRAECKPTIKTEVDRQALVLLIAENHPWVMAGADDAAHHAGNKHVHEGQCACGAYTAPFLAQLYAHALEHLFATTEGVDTFVNFTSRNARRVYHFPRASRKVRLERRPFKIPYSYDISPWTVEPFWAGKTLNWSIAQ